jgi:hypothetical protein
MSTLPVVVTVRNESGLTTTAGAVIRVADTSQRGKITAFNPETDNWQKQDNLIIDGKHFFVETANKAHSLTKLDDYTIRFEVRSGDEWADDETSRSEILTIENVQNGGTFDVSWGMLIEPGPIETDLDWRSCLQMHDGPNPIVSLSIKNDFMNVMIDQVTAYKQPYADRQRIQRGKLYSMRMQGKLSTDRSGFLNMWRDGVQIVSYKGPVGAGDSAYFKFGIYQGWPERVSIPLAIRYSNIAIDIGAAPPPAPPSPLPPGLNGVGETTILPTPDNGNAGLICAQKVTLPTAGSLQSLSFYLTLAAGNIRLGLYDASLRKVAETCSSAAVPGWNTQPVAPVDLQPGDYWLAYEVSSNSATFRKGNGGSLRVAPAAFGTMPAELPQTTSSESVHWSFYMTVNV